MNSIRVAVYRYTTFQRLVLTFEFVCAQNIFYIFRPTVYTYVVNNAITAVEIYILDIELRKKR